MPSMTIHIAGEFHCFEQVNSSISAQFTSHAGKVHTVTGTQFNIVFRLGLVEHASITSGVGLQHNIVRGNPGTGKAKFYNETFLLGGHPAAIEAGTSTPVTFVHRTVAGFSHIEAMVLHRGSEASTEHSLREKSAHTEGEGEILEVVLVVLDIEHAEATRKSKTSGEAGSLFSGFSFGLLLGLFGSNGISDGLLTGSLFGSGDRIGASLFGGNGVGNSLLASLFGCDRIGNGLLAGGFNSGSATFGVNLLTQSVYGARIYSGSFSYRFGRSGFSSRSSLRCRRGSCGSRGGGRNSLGCRGGGGRSRCGSRGRSGSCGSRGRSRCRCGRGLSIGATDHRGKEHNHCKFLHRFSIHKRVCIKITRNI